MRRFLPILALLAVALAPQSAHAARADAWFSCSLHLDLKTESRIVSHRCYTIPMPREHGRPTGWRITRTRVSPHVIHSIRFPRFAPRPALSACIWSSVRRFGPAIAAASARSGVPQDVIAATIETESAGDVYAESAGGDGADVGLMQFGPNEAALVGGSYTYQPAANILTGSLILAYLRDHYAGGSLYTAIAMYNGGIGAPNDTYASIVWARAAC